MRKAQSIQRVSRKGAEYLSGEDFRGHQKSHSNSSALLRFRNFWNSSFLNVFKATAALLFSVFLVGTGALTVGNVFREDVLTAFAQDDDDFNYEEEVSDAGSSLIDESDVDTSSPEGFREMMGNVGTSSQPASEGENGLAYVLHRIIGPGYYANDTEYAVQLSPEFGNDTPDWMCYGEHSQQEAANEGWDFYPDSDVVGTPSYHNCAIPNFTTNLMQKMAFYTMPYGVGGAQLDSTVDDGWFSGTPSIEALPSGEGVPVDPDDRQHKYTGLELFGYNLGFTTYAGEWDYVERITEAGLMRRMGHFDRLLVGGASLWNGLNSAVSGAIEGASDEWGEAIESDNLLTAVGAPAIALWGAVSGATESFADASIRTYLDTDDYNVMQSNSWHRPANAYPSTVYGTDYLSDRELSLQIQIQQNQLLNEAWNRIADEIGYTAPPEFEAVNPSNNFPSLPDSEDTRLANASNDGENITIWENLGSADEIMEMREGEDGEIITDEDTDEPVMFPTGRYECTAENAILGSEIDNADDTEGTVNRSNDDQTCYEEDYIEVISWEEWVSQNSGYFNAFDEQVGTQYESAVEVAGYDLPTDSDSFRSRLQSDMQSAWNNEQEALIEEAFHEEVEASLLSWLGVSFESSLGILDESVSGTRSTSHPSSRFVCTDENGNKLREEGNYHSFVWLYPDVHSTEIDPRCNINEVRPPVQGALMGDGHENYDPGSDTRREAYDQSGFLDGIANMISNLFFSATKLIVSLTNWLIGLSYSPILEFLQIDEILVSMLSGFTSSIFFPFATVFVALAGIVILWRVISSREYRRGFVDIALVIAIFAFGVVLMSDEERLVDWADQVPAAVENTFVAFAFGAANHDYDPLCVAGSTAEGESFVDSDNVSRAMMCETWRALVLSPWAYGQFGASYHDLYSAGNAPGTDGNFTPSEMQNTNTQLVGDAAVRMGPSASDVERNWALYHLQATTSGTTTHPDLNRGVGNVDRNFYRLVDLQAGPNGGAESDGRYLSHWSGNNWGDRMFTSFLSAFVSIFGLVAIFAYAVLKMQYSLLITLLLLALPVMFLIGLEPSLGRKRLRDYLMTFVALTIKRAFLAFAMTIMMIIVANIGADVGDSYFTVAIASVIVFAFFIWFRGKFLEWIQQATDRMADGTANFGGISHLGDKSLVNHVKNNTAFGRTTTNMTRRMTGGAIGSATAHAKLDAEARLGELRADGVNNPFRLAGAGLTGAITGAGSGAVQGARSSLKMGMEYLRSAARMNNEKYSKLPAMMSLMQETSEETVKDSVKELKNGDYDNSLRFAQTGNIIDTANRLKEEAEKKNIDVDDSPVDPDNMSAEERVIREEYDSLSRKYDRLVRGEAGAQDISELHDMRLNRHSKKRLRDLSRAARSERKRAKKEVEANLLDQTGEDADPKSEAYREEEKKIFRERMNKHFDIERYSADQQELESRYLRNRIAGFDEEGTPMETTIDPETQEVVEKLGVNRGAQTGNDFSSRYRRVSDIGGPYLDDLAEEAKENRGEGWKVTSKDDNGNGINKLSVVDRATGHEMRILYDDKIDSYMGMIIHPDGETTELEGADNLQQLADDGYNELGGILQRFEMEDRALDHAGWTAEQERDRNANTDYKFGTYDYSEMNETEYRQIEQALKNMSLDNNQRQALIRKKQEIEKSRGSEANRKVVRKQSKTVQKQRQDRLKAGQKKLADKRSKYKSYKRFRGHPAAKRARAEYLQEKTRNSSRKLRYKYAKSSAKQRFKEIQNKIDQRIEREGGGDE